MRTPKRDQYLEFIYNLMIENGFNSFQMDDIAEKVGVTKMTLYNNFSTKHGLYKAIISYRSTKFLEFLGNVSKKKRNAIDELMAVLEFQQQNPLPEISVYYRSFLQTNPRVFRLYKARFRRILKIFIINNIKRGVTQGLYRDDVDAENIASFSISTMDNMMDKWLVSDMKLDLNATHEHIIIYHIRGIATQTGIMYLEQYLK